jgi:ElaB/YqjD/DUF883 family membrane-anchored ribosome-binding protein
MAAPINRLESIWSRSEGQDVGHEQVALSRRTKLWENSLENLLAKHPKAAIAAAAAVGIALGWIVKRK